MAFTERNTSMVFGGKVRASQIDVEIVKHQYNQPELKKATFSFAILLAYLSIHNVTKIIFFFG